jgi:hypothetical protein
VFENSVLRRICEPKRDVVIGKWKKLYNEELNDLYFPSNIVQVIKSGRIRWAGYITRMGQERGVYSDLVGKPEGKRPLWKPWCRWEY